MRLSWVCSEYNLCVDVYGRRSLGLMVAGRLLCACVGFNFDCTWDDLCINEFKDGGLISQTHTRHFACLCV